MGFDSFKDRTLLVRAIDFGDGLVIKRASGGEASLLFPGSISVVTSFDPDDNDGATLGQSGLAWSDLFLASGAVINFAAGDLTITHATGVLTIAQSATALVLDGTQDFVKVTAADLRAGADNAVAIGAAGATFSDIFLGDGAVINFNAGNVTITHSAATLTLAATTLALGATNLTMTGTIAAGNTTLTALTGTLDAPIIQVSETTATHVGNAVISQAHGTFTGAASRPLTGSTQMPANSLILGVNMHITTDFTTVTNVQLGTTGDPNAWGDTLAITAGTKTAPTDYTITAPFYNGAAANVLLDDQAQAANVTGGVAGYTIYYIQMPAITYTP